MRLWRKKRELEEKKETPTEPKETSRVMSPQGFVVVASSGPDLPASAPVDRNLTKIEVLDPEEMLFECGHRGAREILVTLYGETALIKGKKFKPEGTMCPECLLDRLKKISIQCALCGAPILPGESVALYHKESLDVRKEWATYVGNAVIGCLRMVCCPSGGFFAGHWTTEGFQSSFEGRTMTEEAQKRVLEEE